MKSTRWISDKLKQTQEELRWIDSYIFEKGLTEDECKKAVYFKNGKNSNLTIHETILILLTREIILTDILKG